MPVESATESPPPVTRAERSWLAIAVFLGAILRLGALSTVAVEHFDEAVYSSNLLFSGDDGQFPMRQFYAPPLLPAAIEWTTVFGQMIWGALPTWWPMLPGLLAGLATIPSAWWIVRQWFGPSAGIAAALLIAGDEFLASYSRTSLTDVPLSFFMLWAVYWFWRSLPSGELGSAILAGTFTALAWWTKYNGWLPLAIAAAGGALWQISLPAGDRNGRRFLRNWGLAAVTAAVLWSPVLWDCQKVGGYGNVAENHRRYVAGFSQWLPNAVRGFEYLDEFLGEITLVGVGIAIALRFLPERLRPSASTGSNGSSRILAESLLAVWFWGLVAATPLYHPYSRLWTPCWLAAKIGLGALIVQPRFWAARPFADTCLRFAGAAALLVVLLSSFHLPAVPSCFDRRDGFSRVARQIRERVASNQAAIVVGVSDPALWMQLRRAGAPAVMQSSFDFAEQRQANAIYVVLGPLSQQLESIQHEWNEQSHRFEFVEEFPCRLSRISLLDLHSPQELAANPELRVPAVRLYRLRR